MLRHHLVSLPPTGLWVQGHPLGSGGRAGVTGRGDPSQVGSETGLRNPCLNWVLGECLLTCPALPAGLPSLSPKANLGTLLWDSLSPITLKPCHLSLSPMCLYIPCVCTKSVVSDSF